MRSLATAMVSILFWAGTPLSVRVEANEVDAFYRGKQIALVIGYSAGGGYDQYARLFARHFGSQLPGAPTIVPQNMPGAGSRKAANWLFRNAPRDGTPFRFSGKIPR